MSPRILLCCLAATVLAACSSVQPAPGKPDERAAASGECTAEPVQWAIGQPASQEVMGKVWRESHGGLIRPIAPNQAVTQDYRADRVNVVVDKDNVITRIYCG
ncbi:hypothetical protein CSC70_12935 [Pseudoxanthomonas kalamensis DSM 18571]|uniref:I78 family peptidase inhibitor n=1 Tax=Pseudoxanthomonas kalamensis TaxID=289483 RepID=UPI001391420E|nr:I78 family peptidase inhibitor [Pseudoxanthomonas kalamensis]KAF1708544.1 hypothetical protein CSC70_12935 [Pseudoxanthomonas kalamensis DSM 18571]